MCELCSNPEQGKKAALHMAERLEKLAGDYRSMADGLLDPHGPKIQGTALTAKSLVRHLVEEWV